MDISGLKVIGFDMDGTLFNSSSVSYDAIREGFENFWLELGENGPVASWEQVKRFIGLPSYEFFPAVLPESHRDHWELLHKHVGDAEKRRLKEGRGRCFDGVHETLTGLRDRGYKLVCLTNASSRYFDAVLDGCNLRGFFDRLCFLGEDFGRDKADVLCEWVNEFGGTDTLIYIGDRKADIDAAHVAGIKAIGVTWGYGLPHEMKHADVLVDRMIDLLKILDRE